MWPFKKKEVPQAPKEPEPPKSEPIRIAPGFPEYVSLAVSVEFNPAYLLRESLRNALGKIGVEEFSFDAVHHYLEVVSHLRKTQFTFRWLRSKDQLAAGIAAPKRHGGYAREKGFVPARALDLVKSIEETLGTEFPNVEVELDDGARKVVPGLIFSVTVIPEGDNEQVFLTVQDVYMNCPDIFICSWKNDDSLEYPGEGAKDL